MGYPKNQFLLCILPLLIFLTTGCTKESPLSTRHQTSGYKIPPPLKGNRFSAEYLPAIRQVIVSARKNAGISFSDTIIDNVAPFEFLPDQKTCKEPIKNVLLVHGMSDSPYLLREIGARFTQNCYKARSILLPGHGTVPGDLTDPTIEKMIEYVKRGISSFETGRPLALVGFSSGAGILLYLSMKNELPENISSLLLLSPGIKSSNSLIALSGLMKFAGKFFPPLAWVDIEQDNDPYKYESFPMNAAWQFYRLTQMIKERMKTDIKSSVPVFMVTSGADGVIDPMAVLSLFCKYVKSGERRLLYYGELSGDANSCEGVSVLPGNSDNYNVMNISHVAIPVSPLDPFYGAKGKYRSCMHYDSPADKHKREACEGIASVRSNEKFYLGEIPKKKRADKIVRRLTFNPFFDEMVDHMIRFDRRP